MMRNDYGRSVLELSAGIARFGKNNTKNGCVLVQVHKPRKNQGVSLDKYTNEY